MSGKSMWTPGPWYVFGPEGTNRQIGVFAKIGTMDNHVARVFGPNPQRADEVDQIQMANAHLIAAAPEMYEALVAMHACLNNRIMGTGADPVHDHEFWVLCRRACDLSRDAQAKARGETS